MEQAIWDPLLKYNSHHQSRSSSLLLKELGFYFCHRGNLSFFPAFPVFQKDHFLTSNKRSHINCRIFYFNVNYMFSSNILRSPKETPTAFDMRTICLNSQPTIGKISQLGANLNGFLYLYKNNQEKNEHLTNSCFSLVKSLRWQISPSQKTHVDFF